MLTNLLAVDARPHSPFAAMLLSPQPFRVKVSGGAGAPPVRRCLTHLLPVRPTSVGRTDLTSQGAPRSVTHGEPDDRKRICPTCQLPRDAESANSRRRPFPGLFLRLFATARRCSQPREWPKRIVTQRPNTTRFPACWCLLTGQTLPRTAPIATPELILESSG